MICCLDGGNFNAESKDQDVKCVESQILVQKPSQQRVNYHRWVVSLIEKIKSMSGGKLDIEIQFFENHMKIDKNEWMKPILEYQHESESEYLYNKFNNVVTLIPK